MILLTRNSFASRAVAKVCTVQCNAVGAIVKLNKSDNDYSLLYCDADAQKKVLFSTPLAHSQALQSKQAYDRTSLHSDV